MGERVDLNTLNIFCSAQYALKVRPPGMPKEVEAVRVTPYRSFNFPLSTFNPA
jgi:hypothetical protein